MKIHNHNLLLPRLFFGSPVFANNMSKGWIGLLPTRQQAPTFCVPLPHAPRLCRLLKVPLHGQCAHRKKLHVSQENTYPHCSASEIATSQSARKYKSAPKRTKIQPGDQPQLCPSLESPTSSPRWTSLWQPGSTDLRIFASTHPYIHVSLYPCIHSSCIHASSMLKV